MRGATGARLAAAAAVLLAACAHGAGRAGGQPGATAGAWAAAAPAGPAAAPVPGWRVSPGQFVSLRLAPARQQTRGPMGFLEVALGDVRTGTVVRRLLPASPGSGTGCGYRAISAFWLATRRGFLSAVAAHNRCSARARSRASSRLSVVPWA